MHLKKNLILNTILSISNILFPLISFPYASQILKPEGMGAVAYVDSFTQFFILVAALGIPTYGVREIAKHKNDPIALNKIFSELFFLHIIATFITIIIFLLVIEFNSELAPYTGLCVIGLSLLTFSILPVEWLFMGLEQFDFIVMRTLIIRAITILLLFFVVKSANDIVEYYILNLVGLFLNCFINLYIVRKKVSLSLKSLELKKHLSPLFYILGCTLAISAYTILDTMLLGTLSTTTSVGFYTVAVRLNKIPLAFMSALSVVVIPQLSIAYKEENHERSRNLLKWSLEYVFLLSIPISMGLFILAPEIIELFAGSDFVPATNTMRILTPMALLLGLSNIFGLQILMPLGKERFVFISVIFGMIVSVAGNLLIIPYYQHNGAALVNLTVELIVTVITAFYALKQFPVSFPLGQLIRSLISVIPFIFVVHFINEFSRFSLLITTILNVVVCVLTYLLVQYFVFKNAIVSEALKFVYAKIFKPHS